MDVFWREADMAGKTGEFRQDFGDFTWQVKVNGSGTPQCFKIFGTDPPVQVAPAILPTDALREAFVNLGGEPTAVATEAW